MMAQRQEAPYRPQDRQEVAEMLRGMEAHKGKGKGKGGFSCKKSTFAVDRSDTKVDSWKMQEWDYKKPNLPTYARGLFTTTTRKGHSEIAIRGYDKFFNHEEVTETEWRKVEENTRGPYELSVKENGCIIFLGGLEDGTLLVCSKHSTGARGDMEVSHAKVGEKWVERHLASVGRTKQDLARKLREMNATAVAELCDDEFEEHVLAYTPEAAGLYLHGINLNLPEFATYPHALVDRFAEEWGFKKTMYVLKEHIHEVKEFLDQVAETGNYAGRDTEGFVIRCQSKANTGVWHDWFFKYKFDEPYLMYRQWRECTKAAIAGKQPRIKKHKKITEDYLVFARKQLHGRPDLAKAYNANHGIIKMRDDFLTQIGLRGSDIIRQEQEAGEVSNGDVRGDVILVPIATIGCGKTTIALALCNLFNWGHVQNDNITVKRGKPQAFASACTLALSQHSVMIADRNNHQRREREQLISDVSKVVPHARFVALHFVHDRGEHDNIRATLRERVLSRGDNHQTIHTSKGAQEIIGIMDGFMGRFEPANPASSPDDGFDSIIDLNPVLSSRENLETVVTGLYNEYPKLFHDQQMPTSDEMDSAIDAALHDYEVDIKHEIKSRDDRNHKGHKQAKMQNNNNNNNNNNRADAGGAKAKARKVEYFSVQVAASRVTGVLDGLFRDAAPDVARMYHGLRDRRRVQAEFHVTLIHRAAAAQHADEWARLSDLYSHHYQAATAAAAAEGGDVPSPPDPTLGRCRVRLERLVWDGRVMAFVVRLSPFVDPEDGSSAEQQQFTTVNEIAHVTVGTAAPDIKPKEANDLLVRWLREGSGADNGIRELAVPGNVELDGTVKGVLAR